MALPRWTLLVLLALGPVCFGATEPWSLLLLEAGIVAVFLLWIAISWRRLRVQLDLPTVTLLLFGLLVVVQILINITVYKFATEQELLKITAAFLFFFLARQLFRSDQHRNWLSTFLALFGGAEAVFAIVQKLQGNGQIYWTRATSTQSFFGPYANKNHYAGLMEMLVPFALAGAVNTGEEPGKRTVFAFAASVMVASVFLSGSRTGILVVLFELALIAALMLLRSRESRRRSRTSIAIVMICSSLRCLDRRECADNPNRSPGRSCCCGEPVQSRTGSP